jgi:hypothetical protein
MSENRMSASKKTFGPKYSFAIQNPETALERSSEPRGSQGSGAYFDTEMQLAHDQ